MGEFTNFFRADILNQLGEWGIAYGLILARILGFIHIAPIFSHKSVTGMVRIGAAMLLSFVMLDIIEAKPIPDEGYFYPASILINVMLGMIIAFIARLMFDAVITGGEMMDSSMGFSSGQMFDPATGHQTTIIGRFMGMLGIVVFFSVRGPELLIKGLDKSFQMFDLFQPNISMDIGKLISLTGDVITMGFIIVSPVVLTILIADLVLGLISRTAPQINAFQISFTIKPSIGSIIWLLIMPLFFSALRDFFTDPSRFF